MLVFVPLGMDHTRLLPSYSPSHLLLQREIVPSTERRGTLGDDEDTDCTKDDSEASNEQLQFLESPARNLGAVPIHTSAISVSILQIDKQLMRQAGTHRWVHS